jgi:uncharacterized membrane protein
MRVTARANRKQSWKKISRCGQKTKTLLVNVRGPRAIPLKRLGIAGVAIGFLGILWSWRLLQWFISADTLTACLVGETCPIVFATEFSRFLGLPIHLFALIWFVAMTGLSAISMFGLLAVTKPGLILGSLSVPTVVYLDYVQLAIIKAICWDCVTAHILGLALFGLFAVMFVLERRQEPVPPETP